MSAEAPVRCFQSSIRLYVTGRVRLHNRLNCVRAYELNPKSAGLRFASLRYAMHAQYISHRRETGSWEMLDEIASQALTGGSFLVVVRYA